MLRASAQTTQTEIDIQGINGDRNAAALGVEHGAELMAFAEAVAGGDSTQLQSARESLLTGAGEAVLVDAAGVAANFQRMVRIADSIGIPIDDMTSELGNQVREELGIHRFLTGQNTLSTSS
jgi:hypothetical protein